MSSPSTLVWLIDYEREEDAKSAGRPLRQTLEAVDVNKVIIRGFLGRDPETRYTGEGTAITNFSVATTRRWKDRAGELHEDTEWHRCQSWGKQAEVIAEHFTKGSQILLTGRLQTREWEKDGIKRYTTEIVVEEFEFVDRRGDKPEGGRSTQADEERRDRSRTQGDPPNSNRDVDPQTGEVKDRRDPPTGRGGKHFDDMEDDIPF